MDRFSNLISKYVPAVLHQICHVTSMHSALLSYDSSANKAAKTANANHLVFLVLLNLFLQRWRTVCCPLRLKVRLPFQECYCVPVTNMTFSGVVTYDMKFRARVLLLWADTSFLHLNMLHTGNQHNIIRLLSFLRS